MTTIETHSPAADAAAEPAGPALSGVAAFFVGVADWVTSTDHKKIGRLYIAAGLLLLAASAIVALLLGIERTDDGAAFVDSGALLQLFQLYRVVLVVGGLIPLTLGLSLAVAPLQIGARQVAFARLALTGLYCWVGGIVLAIVALGTNGGFGGGDAQASDQFLAGLGLALVGLAATAVSVTTTILTARAPGVTLRRVGLFSWSALVGALAVLLVVPVAFGAIVYLFVDQRLGIQANFGGTPGIGPWLGWLFGAPAAIAFAIPAVGVVAELFPVTFRTRQALRGVTFAGIALVGVAALAGLTRQTAIGLSFETDQSLATFVNDLVPLVLFAGLPLLGGVVVLGLGALTAKEGTTKAGKPNLTPAFLFAFAGFGLILLGLAGNLLYSLTDLELGGTAFEEGVTLLVAYGALTAVLGGLAFWAPKLCGRVLPALHVVPLALLAAGGTVLAAGAPLIGGALGQAGGIPNTDTSANALLALDYDAAELLAVLGLVGHGAVALAVLAFVALILKTIATGEPAPVNPFKGHTLEWGTSSPAPADNYPVVPTAASAEPVFELSYEGTL